MSRRSLYLAVVFLFAAVLPAAASSVVCAAATGTSSVFTNQACSPMFTAASTLDWGSPIQGSLTGSNSGGLGAATVSGAGGLWPEAVGTTIDATAGGDAFTISSNDQLVRADNTSLAWNGSSWAPAGFVNSTNEYFAGNFGAPNMPTSQPQFGDNLLGALAPSGGDNGPPEITLTFSQGLSFIEFEVSSASDPNFTAELLAFNAQGQQLGTYRVTDTGGGGLCANLNMNPPQPCNDAPTIQFYDPTNAIASVELIMMNDDSGVYIDTLGITEESASDPSGSSVAPEPTSSLSIATGFLLMLGVAKRNRLRKAFAARS